MEKQIVLYGAYDRYNYGDNLMPILLERYFRQFASDKLKDYKFIYASIDSSDLSRYKCLKTVPMKSLMSIPSDSIVIVVGGEVLGADVGTLFTHVQNNIKVTKLYRKIKQFLPNVFRFYASLQYPAAWAYPYIPQKSSFKNNIKVVYNTIGGNPHQSQYKYLSQADYISVRDQRTSDILKRIDKVELVPDSVLMLSRVVDENFIRENIRDSLKDFIDNRKFITIQACPYKTTFTAKDMAEQLNLMSMDVVLLPIGYASGHDDRVFLSKVDSLTNKHVSLFDDLNIWEIMYFIAKSQSFFGTSLHGVITAMSFGIPHFCINPTIEKLTSFLNTWSIHPFNSPLNISQLNSTVEDMESYDNSQLVQATNKAQDIIFDSLNKISSLL